MANRVFVACGAKQYGYPATWAEAKRAVHQQLVVQMGKQAEAIVQVEGAGLALENQVTAHAMLQLLQAFRPQLGLLKKEQDVSMKTGTLTGVSTLAGFLPGGESFVILLNHPSNSRAEVLNRIKKRLAATPRATGGDSTP